ncbi:PilZ domain-containing protein [Rheinheimera texasensis]|uniref:PilZ domain-containing protein n=1 Tax=Rheinheimera texasensis TaxID=306205 RepID=UPI0004E1CE98|nr:PilZ domain-containing protein [Rheinheimera texasensis]
MDSTQLNLLKEQYNDYFIIEHDIRINVKPFAGEEPDEQQFERLIPEPFLMAGEQVLLEQSALKSLNRLGELAEELAVYLRIQARKIDSMMRYILMQQDDPQCRHFSHSYGGSALCFDHETAFTEGTLLEVKMFMDNSDGAVFALVRVIGVEPVGDKFRIRTTYTRIREQDRELIVRASLHQQSRQLKRKAELRQQQGQA